MGFEVATNPPHTVSNIMSDSKFVQTLWSMPQQPPAIDISPILRRPSEVEGRIVVVTGANVGLGYEAAKHFATLKPARLVLGCRNEEKGKKAVEGMLYCLIVHATRLTCICRLETSYRLRVHRASTTRRG